MNSVIKRVFHCIELTLNQRLDYSCFIFFISFSIKKTISIQLLEIYKVSVFYQSTFVCRGKYGHSVFTLVFLFALIGYTFLDFFSIYNVYLRSNKAMGMQVEDQL